MAKFTTKQRKALPAADFAGPNRSYPVPDKSHAANAKARASQQVKKGKMSAAQYGHERKHGNGHEEERRRQALLVA